MNLPAHKPTAKLIIAIAEPHVDKAMNEGDTDAAMAFQGIITLMNLALETGKPIEFK